MILHQNLKTQFAYSIFQLKKMQEMGIEADGNNTDERSR
jgi:hypothetical protein